MARPNRAHANNGGMSPSAAPTESRIGGSIQEGLIIVGLHTSRRHNTTTIVLAPQTNHFFDTGKLSQKQFNNLKLLLITLAPFCKNKSKQTTRLISAPANLSENKIDKFFALETSERGHQQHELRAPADHYISPMQNLDRDKKGLPARGDQQQLQ